MAERQKLQALMKVPGNNKCIDCDAPYPQWASANVGVFMCLECSGVHRGLGVQVSFVRSCTMDKWTPGQVRRMECGGNARATEFFRVQGAGEGYRPNMPIREKYNSAFAEDYREKLAAESEGLPWVKTAARKPKVAAVVQGSSISRTASPASFSSSSNGNNSGNGNNNNNGFGSGGRPRPPGSEAQKAQNEGFFASMGSKNAARSTDVPPSKGGKYVGFGSAPVEQTQERTGRAALDGLAASGASGGDDPLALLSRGWGFFSKTVTSTARTVQEQYLQPGLERIQDPKFSEDARRYVDGFGQKVQEDAKYAYSSASRFVEGQTGGNVVDGGNVVRDSATAPSGYEKVDTPSGGKGKDDRESSAEAGGRNSWDGDDW